MKYIIKSGDTLTGIAHAYMGDGSRWREIYEANRGRIADPDQLTLGTEIYIPVGTQREGRGGVLGGVVDWLVGRPKE